MPRPSRPSTQQRAEILSTSDLVDVRIEKLIEGGEGLGRLQGVPVLVARSAPGDLLRVRLVERHPDYGRAEIEEILEAGAGRREPPCPYYDQCGGCDLQHLEDDLQVKLKVEAALETLRRLGGVEPEAHRLVRAQPWAYRLRAQLQIERGPSGVPAVGFRRRRSRELVAIDHCAVLDPQLDGILADVRTAVATREEVPRRLDVACAGGRVACAPKIEGLPHGELLFHVGELEYAFDARCFFQGHSSLVEELVGVAVGDEKGELAVDLYAGVGLFSLPLAQSYHRVTAIESDQIAVRYARRNARRNRLRNLEVRRQAVERALTDGTLGGAERVLVDPPRSGLPRPVRRWMLQQRPPRVTYVSCQPATLARDLKALLEAYRLGGVTFLDLFPQTGHLEVVAQLTLR